MKNLLTLITLLQQRHRSINSEYYFNRARMNIKTNGSFFRLLNCFAEEAATEDTIYYMGEALRQGVIDLDVFLKQVRALSRKQFMLRATMQACRKKAGLAG